MKGFHTLGSPFMGRDCGWRRGEASEPCSNRGAEGKAEKFPH